MKALMIIDMQKGSFIPETPRLDAEGVIQRINRLAKRFREKGLPVVFIQHNGTSHGEFIPQTEEWEILDELVRQKGDIIVEKIANDSFYQSKLKDTLQNLKVKELWITGCATDFCVNSTIQSALTKDYLITVVKDGHTTMDRPGIKGNMVFDYYNWLWENMIPTKEGIKVIETQELLAYPLG